MSKQVICPSPRAGGQPGEIGWGFNDGYRVALQVEKGELTPFTPAATLGPEISRAALERAIENGSEDPSAPYLYSSMYNYNPGDPREVDFQIWEGPVAAGSTTNWRAVGWYKLMPDQPLVSASGSEIILRAWIVRFRAECSRIS